MESMKDKKAAKKIIKRAKHNPQLYSKDEVKYAKIAKKRLKKLNLKRKNTNKVQMTIK